MEKYIGMNFKDWCSLDIKDERNMNVRLKLKNQVKNFNSNKEISWHEMFLLQESIIDNILLKNDEWYIDLYFPH